MPPHGAAVQGRFVTRIGGLLSDPMNTAGIVSRWMSYLQQIDSSLPNQVRLCSASLHGIQ